MRLIDAKPGIATVFMGAVFVAYVLAIWSSYVWPCADAQVHIMRSCE